MLLSGQAQTPVPVHAVRSISPGDTDFGDLEFLTQEIGPARVVMLGEPSHGEGNVFEAKIRLLRFLQQRMGFTTLAFESGFYDLHKAQQALEAGKSAEEALSNSVFPVWTNMQEFQAVLPLVGRGNLRVAGFDPQLSGLYGEELVEELQAFLTIEKGGAALNYDYLEEVISYMGERYAFAPTAKLADFEKELAKASRLADRAATGPATPRRAEAAFWQQCLRSLLAQARDYALNDPGAKTETTFKAKDSNPRDAQMADNLLWYLKQHPQEKVICWGALPHLANKAEMLADAEIGEYRPMGRAVKAALGPDQVYVLGTLSGSGSHGAFGANVKPVPVPAPGSLEAELLAQPADYAFVSLKHDAPGRVLTTYAFDYQPLSGLWSEVVDGFLFLRSVNPPHGATATIEAAQPTGAAAEAAPATSSVLNPAARAVRVRLGNVAAAGPAVRGVVLDWKTGQPVPYASVSVPGRGVGTVADGAGRFVLASGGGDKLQISSVGYATVTVPASAAATVRLVPSAYELQGVQVRGESLDPRKIMKKVLAALPQNYEQEDYSSEVYTHRQTTNFDTLSYETEYVSQYFEPAGHRHWGGGFLMLGSIGQHRVKEIHPTKELSKGQKFFSEQNGPGFIMGTTDAVRISPLFKTSTFRKFNVHLDSVLERDGTTVYVIGFAAKHANHRSTGTYLTAGYSGRLYVQQRDYAVTRYESIWLADTAYINRAARQHYGQRNLLARLYPNLLTDSRTDHAADYVRAPNGRYYLRHSLGQSLDVGRTLGGSAFYRQSSCEEYHSPLPVGTPPILSKAEMTSGEVHEEMAKLPPPEYHPEFWQTYQRPSALGETVGPAGR
ncbi:erythromycin esterase family protein [Hymenobacter negativus]|uniref:Erythromycin esterase family protein n=1 Tax=Hymenobacter negativus TaxID=2795026 RepID=A0ABS3QNW1_9BACT|nr:erythromycin esterase family protein [Hymenobacter negativus]MBO2012887.1 erythromycin esterase family protein [Hymenobacter negativus]